MSAALGDSLEYWGLKLRAIGALVFGRARLAESLFDQMLVRWPI